MKEWRELMATRSTRDDVPMKPQVVAAALNDLLADDAIISTDRNDYDVGGAVHPDEARAAVLLLGQSGDDGAAGCPTRSPRRSRIPGGSRWHSSATAGSPC